MSQHPRILIVDDEEGMRESLTFMLESEGLTDVLTVRDGEQALKELEQGPFGLVITDLVMPKMNGYTLMQTVQGRWPNTLVIAITGFGSTASATECLRRGAFDYITKPFDMDVILAVIHRALDRVKLEAEGRARAEQLAVMAEITRIINSSLDIHDVYRPFTEEVRRLVRCDVMNIALVGGSDSLLRILVTTAPEASRLAQGKTVPMGGSLLGRVSSSGTLLSRADLAQGERLADEEALFQEGIRSLIVVPLVVKNEVIGTFCVGSEKVHQYAASDEDLVSRIGGLVSTATHNALLFEQIQSQLARLRQTQSQLIRSARLAAVGELADGVAHEINNPLSVILGITQLLSRQQNLPPGIAEDLDKIAISSNRVASIIRTFTDFAKPAAMGEQSSVQIDDVLDSALLLSQSQVEGISKTVRVEKNVQTGLPLVLGNEGQLRRAFVNIIRNALEAMAKIPPPEEGHVLRLRAVLCREKDRMVVELTVEDTGCGIPAADLPRIFEPGFTTKIERGTVRGLGMGLFSAYGIIDTHAGEINVESELGHGTRVLVTLPSTSH